MSRTDDASLLGRGRVPAEPFRTVLIEMMERHGYTTDSPSPTGASLGRTDLDVLPISALADVADVPMRTLYNIVQGTYSSFDFDVCDRLICALDGSLAWWSSALRGTYEALNLVHLDVQDAVVEASEALYEGKCLEQT